MKTRKLIQQMASLLPRKFIYCDVGARGGIEAHPWNPFVNLMNIISFEPDDEEYRLLIADKRDGDKIFNYAVYKETGKVILNLTKSRAYSSIYKPNFEFLRDYPDSDRLTIEKVTSVDAIALDELYDQNKIQDIDFIKIDVQGAALDVIMGGKRILGDNVLGMEVEVEFQPLYKHQPLFSNIDQIVRESFNLEIQDIRKTYWKRSEGIGIGPIKGQLIYGDVLYFRSPQEIIGLCNRLSKERAYEKIVMAWLMGFAYGYIDYALCLLNHRTVESILGCRELQDLKSLTLNRAKCFRYNRFGSKILAGVANILYRFSQPNHQNWGTADHHLGNRKRFGIFT